MEGYTPLVRWDSRERSASAACRHCPFVMDQAAIANVRIHILVNPSHHVDVTTTARMEFSHASPGVRAHVG